MDRNESSRPEPRAVVQTERLGGVRADFVATLGRRVVELRSAVNRLADDPGSSLLRDDLRRRVHALAAAARLLRFNKVAEELGSSESLVDRIAERGRLTDEEWKALRGLLDGLPELAWGEACLIAAEREISPRSAPPPRSLGSGPRTLPSAESSDARPAPRTPLPEGAPLTVLFVGSDLLATALAGDHEEGAPMLFEVERTNDLAAAPDLARALAPDVFVIDVDLPGARDLVAALLADPLVDEVPLLLLGRFQRPNDAGLYAALGVARTLPKPVSPDALRKACLEVRASHTRRTIARAPIGQVSLDELGDRLANELRHGLCDAAEKRGHAARVDLGEGSEVLAALWGAVARIRDLVTIESRGQVRFTPSGPEGALPIAPWLGGPEGMGKGARAFGQARGEKAPSLEGVKVLVADDDAAITWFLAGVLRAAGARVYEARDGERAFELACEVSPDLVVSDIVMPGLDGFALCRAIKRDFALRDVPVVLLSWKEDLLQRVRELGAGADGYLRKEASASAIVHRLREILRPRLRVAERLAMGGEVRGRLEGLTPPTLLTLACAHRPASTLTVRDALDLYEVEIRDGRPVRATRTTADGSFERGPGVLTRLLGLGAGRFVVAPLADDDTAHLSTCPDLSGSLAEQLAGPVASARAAQRLLSGAALMSATRVEIDLDLLGPIASATPETLRAILLQIASGMAPRTLIAGGKVAAHLVEDVLCDVAAHGAITAIVGEAGVDLLTPAVELESERLRGVRRPPPPPFVPSLADILPEPAPSTPQPISAVIERSATPLPVLARDDLSPPVKVLVEPEAEVVATASEADIPFLSCPLPDEPTLDVRAPIEPAPAPASPKPALAAKAPVPVVVAAPPAASAPQTRISSRPPARPIPTSLGSLVPPPVEEMPPARGAFASAQASRFRGRDEEVESRPTNVRRSSKDRRDSEPPSRRENPRTRIGAWILFALAGTAFAVGSRVAHNRAATPAPEPAAVVAPGPDVPAEAPAATEPDPAAAAATPIDRKEGDSADFPVLPQDAPLRAEDKVPAGQGLLEIVAGPTDAVHVDNQLVGTGPVVQAKLPPKKEPYEIRVRLKGEERIRFALVKEGRATRIRIAPPWSR